MESRSRLTGDTLCWSPQKAADALGVRLVRKADRQAPWHPGRCAALIVDGKVIGHAGELHPTVVSKAGLPQRTCAVEFNLDALVAAAPRGGEVHGYFKLPGRQGGRCPGR